jgi:Zinc carboxypeptidase
MRQTLVLLLALSAGAPGALPAQRRPIRPLPTPASLLGFTPGTDRRLVEWGPIVDYFRALDAASDRVSVRTIGRSTNGLPFIAVFVSSAANLRRLPALRESQRRLADPRLSPDSGEAARLAAGSPAFALITSSVHSTEVGGFFAPLELAYRLARGATAETRAILDSTVLILVPSLNPDGVDIVSRWYAQTLGTAAEGAAPPELYNRYVGHDDNRDWYAFTQIETRLVVDSLYGVWHPQVTMDIHQQGAFGSRIFVPPYRDPVEPNVDPLLVEGVNALGTAIAWRLTAEGLTGVSLHASYDAWTPARAFQHYHGAVRILTETASANLASPITVPFDSLRPGDGIDPRVRSWNFAAPWPGGRWTLSDIVRYQTSAALAMLDHVTRNRAAWLRTARLVAERAVRGWPEWPYAYVIPATGQDPAAVATLLGILQHAQVEVRSALEPFTVGRERFGPGTYVVPLRQPYAAFVAALFPREYYPDLREYPGGPPVRPYDATAHALPLLLGVRALAVPDSLPVALSAPVQASPPVYREQGLSVAPGARPPRGAVRLGVYRSFAAPIDEGWTRYVLDTWSIPFESVTDSTMRAGSLGARFDALVLPSQPARSIVEGLPARRYPARFAGGIGPAGVAALRDFVEGGGTLIALDDACDFAIDALDLPVANAVSGMPPRDFYVPGSILRILLDTTQAMADGLPAQTIAWAESGIAFDGRDPSRVKVVARYPAQAGDVLLSGWLIGAGNLVGRAALAEVRDGRGRVVLFGFRPQYRGQSLATLPLLFNAIRTSAR